LVVIIDGEANIDASYHHQPQKPLTFVRQDNQPYSKNEEKTEFDNFVAFSTNSLMDLGGRPFYRAFADKKTTLKLNSGDILFNSVDNAHHMFVGLRKFPDTAIFYFFKTNTGLRFSFSSNHLIQFLVSR
jgi:hypothetical protein